jgi:uncharacterized protein YciI
MLGGSLTPSEAGEAGPAGKLAGAAGAQNAYLVLYRRGPAWVEGKPMREQPSLPEHFAFYLDLHRQGRLIAGGGFTDESGGAAVFSAAGDEEAAALVAADPAVRSGVFRHELQRWKLNPWDEIARSREAN